MPAEQPLKALAQLTLKFVIRAGRYAECTAHAAARLKASGMAITGAAAGRRK
jgi:hypothetical protein